MSKDPHKHRECELMEAGSKKLACFYQERELAGFGSQYSFRSFDSNGYTKWLVFKPEDVELADRYVEVHRKNECGELSREDATRLCGELLGYEARDIEYFVLQRRPFK